MDKEAFKRQLEKYNFRFVDYSNIVTIKLEYSLVVDVDFNLFEKILISDRLLNWNFLTLVFPMKLKHAVIYDFFALLVVAFICIYEAHNINQFYLIIAFMSALSWVLLWSVYYNLRSENLKRVLMIWLEAQK